MNEINNENLDVTTSQIFTKNLIWVFTTFLTLCTILCLLLLTVYIRDCIIKHINCNFNAIVFSFYGLIFILIYFLLTAPVFLMITTLWRYLFLIRLKFSETYINLFFLILIVSLINTIIFHLITLQEIDVFSIFKLKFYISFICCSLPVLILKKLRPNIYIENKIV